MNRSLLQGGFDLCEHLIGHGIGAIIAGGCARDLFFGVVPKDIDIICAGSDPETVSRALDEGGFTYHKLPKYHTGSDSDRLQGVWKIEGSDIDVILYETECVSEAIQKFDYNLNQFAITGIQRGIEGATIRFMGAHCWGNLVRLREDARGDRAEKMEAKWLDLSWRVHPELNEREVADVVS
ncbi:tRNA nucleotidyltransferase [Pseudomonas phage PlaquesPlease]|uniref:tRNA nucleotidyltransferase n=1 Tax=Pseudomonas phage PlaquesPlease TaxID=2762289 RepID=A0A7G8LJT6_9CAUD|nr:tRNA nucleotidyltransferase [Pseudomonas phage PlaquesPlease]